jgi:TolB-like protein/tetratricopeptide (TPR) repeat protein
MNGTLSGNGPVRFGPFEFDPDSLELFRRGVAVRLHGQPLQLLSRLLNEPGTLVTRDALRHALWPDGTYVDFEHGLNAAMRRLRRALEDEADTPRYVQTLARRGYRFVGTVEEVTDAHWKGAKVLGRTIAVLPFDNTTGDVERDYLAEGITERLIGDLALSRSVRVMARSAVCRYKGNGLDPRSAGRQLGVSAVVVGAVSRREGTTLSIHAELVEVARGYHLWGRSYECEPEDLRTIEADLVRDLHDALQVRPSGERLPRTSHTTSAAAHLEYLKGRYFLNRPTEGALRRAIEHFTNAINADDRYALAYCGLADCYSLFAFLGMEAPNTALPQAREAASAALQLNGALAEAHASLASIAKVYEWNWTRAEAGYRRALTLNPSYAAAHRWYAAHLAALGRRDESRCAIEQASALDPVSPLILTEASWNAYMAREFDVARSHATDALGLHPEFPPALFALGLAHEQLGCRNEALDAFRTVAAHAPNPAVTAAEVHLLATMGRHDEALTLKCHLERAARDRYVAPYWLAIAAAGLDAIDEGLDALERACDAHDVWLVWLKTEPRLDPLRGESRFDRVLERVGLGNGHVRHASATVDVLPRVAFQVS